MEFVSINKGKNNLPLGTDQMVFHHPVFEEQRNLIL
jgi:hypothetical protein